MWPSEETTPPRCAWVASLGQRRKVTSFAVLTAPLLRIQGLCEARSTSGSPGRNWFRFPQEAPNHPPHVVAQGARESRAEAARPRHGTGQALRPLYCALLGAGGPARPCIPCTAYCWVQGGPAQPDLKGRNQGPSPNASSQPRGS